MYAEIFIRVYVKNMVLIAQHSGTGKSWIELQRMKSRRLIIQCDGKTETQRPNIARRSMKGVKIMDVTISGNVRVNERQI